LNRKIIFFENHFIEFYQNQDNKVKGKIQYVFELIKQVDRVPEKFLKHLIGTNGLYEIRIEHQTFTEFSAVLIKENLWFYSTDSKKRRKKHQKMKLTKRKI